VTCRKPSESHSSTQAHRSREAW